MANPIPKGLESFVPHLVFEDASKAMEFYKTAFGAKEIMRSTMPNGKIMHAEMEVDGRRFFLNDDFPEMSGGKSSYPKALGGTPVTIHLFVKDCDGFVERAKKAGAQVLMGPDDMFWGDRYALLKDPFGHSWSFATHIKDMTPQEMERATKEAFAQS